MDHDQYFRGVPLGPNTQRAAEDGTVPDAHPTEFYPQPTYEHGIGGQAFDQTMTNYPLGHAGSTLLCSPPSAMYFFSRGPVVEPAHDQGDVSSGRQGLHNSVIQVPHNVSGLNEGDLRTIIPPERRGEYPSTYILRGRSFRELPALESQQLDYSPQDSWNEDAVSPLRFNDPASISCGGRHGNQLPVMDEWAVPVPYLSLLPNNLELDPYATMDRTTLTQGGPLEEPWRDRYTPHQVAGSCHWQQQLDNILTSTGPSRRRTDGLERARPLGFHSLSNEGMGNVGHILESSPNLRLDDLPGQSVEARPRKGKRAEQTTGPAETPHIRKSTRNFLDSIAQLRATSVAIRGPTQLVKIPQTKYTCITKQDEWEKGKPIEFGSIKLIDAANSALFDLHGNNERVLNYDGVGSTILCRLDFPGCKIGPSKILTTNNKTIRECITKGKLALEIAKFVWNDFESIKAASGSADITFESMVLVRLVRVSRASWQPELWYEAPIPGPNPS